ncbi:DUF4268 domain-containing protein [Ferrimonas balearica]|uniref:DUF4268 domain-containing protein n=1 Tax=Ferrimonas balearica TaxID=44012 RepID=UPI001C99CD72|nr:DUF4268 domain-containing protein [Ferrimonas balearica]MBY5990511.1 DUF4268 domain-containing protein [Ferrimonas balearica]
MYQIIKDDNRITKLEAKRFSELGFTERHHLQEWLANQLDALGEDLLLIQKEFDGFNETRERLDLLALDREGNLVIIENKLDDSGRDVVWQALKYASYCSSFTKSQIIEAYQSYLDRYEPGQDAAQRLAEFLDVPDLDEVILNSGNQQRLILVAAQFRKEVTSTALWLMSHGITVQCLKVTPYSLEEQYFLNVEQILPPPEAKELMIGIAVKEADEQSTKGEVKHRHILRKEFWMSALEVMRESQCDAFNNISPSKDSWVAAGTGISGCQYLMAFSKREVRIELWMGRPRKEENKALWDLLKARQSCIENTFSNPLNWLRLDGQKSSRITFSHDVEGHDKGNWPEMIQWLAEHMAQLENTLKPHLDELGGQIKMGGIFDCDLDS